MAGRDDRQFDREHPDTQPERARPLSPRSSVVRIVTLMLGKEKRSTQNSVAKMGIGSTEHRVTYKFVYLSFLPI